MLLQVLRQTQALKDSLSFSSNQVSALTAEMEQLRAELEQCRQKAVTDQEQVRCQPAGQQLWQPTALWSLLLLAASLQCCTLLMTMLAVLQPPVAGPMVAAQQHDLSASACHLCPLDKQLLCCCSCGWLYVHSQILKELEGLHLSAAEQLEGLYEARLALEREKLKQMAAAKDDVELSLKVRGHPGNH